MSRNNKPIQQKQGFTIIEVVLVLAVAGLIFLMVFIALPALQRTQRDTQRRNDMSRAITAIQNYQTNNKNNIPDFSSSFISTYLTVGGDTFDDPSGVAYSFKKSAASDAAAGIDACVKGDNDYCTVQAPTTFTAGTIVALSNATCDGEKAKYVSGAKKVALLMKLEGGGIACMSN